jgi:purine nucleoside permease
MRVLRTGIGAIVLVAAIVGVSFTVVQLTGGKIPIKAVVITAFEIGEDTGDIPGETQAWAEVYPHILPSPTGTYDLHYSGKEKILVMRTGIGAVNAALEVQALGQDSRFDLTKAYWLTAGIAGINPHFGTGGSAVWIKNVVDLDWSYSDDTSVGEQWTKQKYPENTTYPWPELTPEIQKKNNFAKNTDLTTWAYEFTKDTQLEDNENLKAMRSHYSDATPNALAPPTVGIGTMVGSSEYWQGSSSNAFAEKWVSYFTKDPTPYAMTAMEDVGVSSALQTLGRLGLADPQRELVLRTASDFAAEPPGKTAAESRNLGGLNAALTAAHHVGSLVLNEIVNNWETFGPTTPTSANMTNPPVR